MSDATTIARPYAKGLFKHALDATLLPVWSSLLHDLAQAVLNPDCKAFISNPATTTEQHAKLLLAVCAKDSQLDDSKVLNNLVNLLAENKRLLVLPDVYVQYEALRAEQEKTLTAYVSSFAELTSKEQENLINVLSLRLQRQVTLDVSIDKSLIGGAVIQAGDLVIDGSVRGKLNKLSATLAA